MGPGSCRIGPACGFRFFVAALRSRCGHYIFALWFLYIFFFSSPLSQRSQIGCLPYFYTWCGPSASLGCRSEMCCARLAGNARPKKSLKKSPSWHHRTTLSGYVFATDKLPDIISRWPADFFLARHRDPVVCSVFKQRRQPCTEFRTDCYSRPTRAPSSCSFKAKFHYAIWSQTGSKLVADLQLVLDDWPNFCSLQLCDQIRAGSSNLDIYGRPA